jgi:hypothetical protein
MPSLKPKNSANINILFLPALPFAVLSMSVDLTGSITKLLLETKEGERKVNVIGLV